MKLERKTHKGSVISGHVLHKLICFRKFINVNFSSLLYSHVKSKHRRPMKFSNCIAINWASWKWEWIDLFIQVYLVDVLMSMYVGMNKAVEEPLHMYIWMAESYEGFSTGLTHYGGGKILGMQQTQGPKSLKNSAPWYKYQFKTRCQV